MSNTTNHLFHEDIDIKVNINSNVEFIELVNACTTVNYNMCTSNEAGII